MNMKKEYVKPSIEVVDLKAAGGICETIPVSTTSFGDSSVTDDGESGYGSKSTGSIWEEVWDD